MRTHANALLTQKVSLRLVSQHLNARRPLAKLAPSAGTFLRCACKWLARYRSGGTPHHRQSTVGQLCRYRKRPSPRGHQDTTRHAYVEVLAAEQQGTAIGFLSRALA
jgi:hypothetical protein